MTATASPRPRPASAKSGRKNALIPTAIVIGVVVLFFFAASQLWTEVLWFNQVGYAKVLWTEWIARIVLGLAAFALVFLLTFFSMRIAYRSRPVYAPSTPQQVVLDTYREQIEPARKLLMLAVPAGFGIMAGVMASAQWQSALLFLNAKPFGTSDPQFGLDAGFYVFTLPFLRSIVSFAMGVLVLTGILALIVHYLYGAVTVEKNKLTLTKTARLHVGIVASVFMVCTAISLWLDRYSLLTKTGERFEGANFTDVHAVLPGRAIMAGIALFVACLFIFASITNQWRFPAVAIALMVAASLVVSTAWPAVVQRFQVTPNAQELESTYLQRNIDATKAAYSLDGVETVSYNAKTEATPGQLRTDAETTASIRLLDPAIVPPTFRQLQQNKQYYDFPEVLNVDRYKIDGKLHDTLIGVRELNLNGLGRDQRTWVNDHTVFTHGFGAVAAYGNQNSADGRPVFFVGGIPPQGPLGNFEPRVYFGQNSPSYSVVGAPQGATPWELDFPDDAAGGQVNSTYAGNGGPKIGNIFTKLLYAMKFGDEELLFSDRVNSQSQILYDRDPRQRVEKVAPYLTLDTRVYPAIVNKRIVWIVDGYTTTNQYPYSAQRLLENVTEDSLSNASPTIAKPEPLQVNYMRNSVKATVDAYDGSVNLYSWNDKDPVLQAWQSVFPNQIKPMKDISGDLMSHLRYPEDLFKVQRQLLTSYHVTDAREFYSGQDFWANSPDPTRNGLQPPYYLTMQMPGQDSPSFSLMSTFIPGGNTNRNVLTAFLAVDSEPGSQGGQPAPGYGKLRMLELARSATVPGPGQVQNNFNSDPTVSAQLNLLQQGGSQVVKGNLLTLPVGQGLLYVQPVYVQSAQGTQYPLLQKVLVAFGDKIGFADTLGKALDQVFGGDSGVKTPDEEKAAPGTPGAPGAPGSPAAPSVSAGEQLKQALSDANKAWQDSQAALQKSDFAGYGAAQERLNAALKRASDAQTALEQAASAVGTAPSAPPASGTPNPAPAPSPQPSP